MVFRVVPHSSPIQSTRHGRPEASPILTDLALLPNLSAANRNFCSASIAKIYHPLPYLCQKYMQLQWCIKLQTQRSKWHEILLWDQLPNLYIHHHEGPILVYRQRGHKLSSCIVNRCTGLLLDIWQSKIQISIKNSNDNQFKYQVVVKTKYLKAYY